MYQYPQQQGYAQHGQYGPPTVAPYGYVPASVGDAGYPTSGISSNPPSGISSGHGFIGSQSPKFQFQPPPPQMMTQSFNPQDQPLMHSFNQLQGQHMQQRGVPGSFGVAPTTLIPAPRKKEGDCAVAGNLGACQDEECGGERKGPEKPKTAFGLNWIYLRPLAVLGSADVAGWCSCFVIFPEVRDLMTESLYNFGFWSLGSVVVSTSLLFLYCMALNAGEMTEEEWQHAQALSANRSEDNESSGSESECHVRLPPRAHKTWNYPRPVLRYDHYCRWLGNSIALRNHRQFFAMLTLLLTGGIVSVAIDSFVLFTRIRGVMAASLRIAPAEWCLFVVMVAHFVYSAVLTYYVQEIFQIHVMLVSRNETAKEWTVNKHWRYDQSVKGPDATWSDMSEAEQDELRDTETYQKELNPYDKGCMNNCVAFWCTSRAAGQDGNF